MLLIIVTEDRLSKVFDLTDETGLLLIIVTPALIFHKTVHDIAEQPLQDEVGMFEVVDELVDSHFLHLVTTQSHTEVCRQFQLMGEVPEHTLEEGVDGLYPETVVMMQEEMKRLSCSFPDGMDREPRLLLYLLCIVV